MAPILTTNEQWKSIRILQRFIVAPQLFSPVPSRRQYITVCQTLLLQEAEIHRDFSATDTCCNRTPPILVTFSKWKFEPLKHDQASSQLFLPENMASMHFNRQHSWHSLRFFSQISCLT